MKIPARQLKGELNSVKGVYTQKTEAINAAKKIQRTSKTEGEVFVRKAKVRRNDGKDIAAYAVTFKKR